MKDFNTLYNSLFAFKSNDDLSESDAGEWKIQYPVSGYYESKLHPSLIPSIDRDSSTYMFHTITSHMTNRIPYPDMIEEYCRVREYFAYKLYSSYKNISYDLFMKKYYVPVFDLRKIPYKDLPLNVSSLNREIMKNAKKRKQQLRNKSL